MSYHLHPFAQNATLKKKILFIFLGHDPALGLYQQNQWDLEVG